MLPARLAGCRSASWNLSRADKTAPAPCIGATPCLLAKHPLAKVVQPWQPRAITTGHPSTSAPNHEWGAFKRCCQLRRIYSGWATAVPSPTQRSAPVHECAPPSTDHVQSPLLGSSLLQEEPASRQYGQGMPRLVVSASCAMGETIMDCECHGGLASFNNS